MGSPLSAIAPAGMTLFGIVSPYNSLSSRTAKPIRDLVTHVRNEIPALRYHSGGDDTVYFCHSIQRTVIPDGGSRSGIL
jgi:hypothetical protein